MNFLNKFKYARDSYIITILIVAIAVMVNYIALNHFVRIDLTKNKIYAVSSSSKTIMRNLNDIVNVKVYFSDKLPPNLFAVRQYVGDSLDELSSYSKGNLSVQFLKPSDPEVQKEALKLGIPQIQMNIVEKDKLEVKKGFLGIAVNYGDRTEVLPVVQNIINIEYDLVSAIKKVTDSRTRVVGFASGHKEPQLTRPTTIEQSGVSSFFALGSALSKNYQVASVDLKKEDALKNIDTLLIAGPKEDFADDEKKAIDEYLINGGNLVVFFDPINISDDLNATTSTIGLEKLFKHYGFEIENKFALDTSNEKTTFNQGYINFIISYPFWIKGINKNFDKANPIVSNLKSFVMPWASPIKITKNKNIKSTILAETTSNAWVQEEPFSLNPNTIKKSEKGNKYPLAVLLEGKFTSFFDQKVAKKEGKILAIGNSRFATDRFVSQFSQNLIFAQNIIDFLTLDDSLISIRSKAAFDLPLKDIDAQSRNIAKLIGIFLMPVLVVAFGIVRFVYKKRRKKIFFQ